MRLDPAELVDFGRFFADEVAAGRCPFVHDNEDQRWHQRLYRDPRVDIWLISWLPSQGTQLHDHGGSSGAFTVLSGALTETVYSLGAGLRDVDRGTGCRVGFAGHYVHDLRNIADQPAVSMHSYSPPLTRMTFYDVEGGMLAPIATVATDHPETELEVPEAS